MLDTLKTLALVAVIAAATTVLLPAKADAESGTTVMRYYGHGYYGHGYYESMATTVMATTVMATTGTEFFGSWWLRDRTVWWLRSLWLWGEP